MSIYEIALLLLFILFPCSAKSTYYVTPTPDTPCPGEPCLSFVEHTRRGREYLENATLVFLPGNHTIESSIEIGNLTSLTLLGNSSLPHIRSRIICSQPASISFQYIEHLTISALGIVSCGFNKSDGLDVNANVVYGAAVVTKSIQNLTVSNCLFENNTLSNPRPNGFEIQGGALAVISSSVAVLQTIFEGNAASYDGGGVYIRNSVANFTRNHFENNQARYGGGVEVNAHSMVYFSDNVFMNNVATFGGGGIDVFNYSTARLFNNTLVKNAATKYGGAVSDEYESSVVFNGNTFSENSAMNGGGVAIQFNSTANFAENKFQNNRVSYRSGGGVYIENSDANFTRNHFENNQARYGGGVEMNAYSMVYFSDNVFMNNVATFGGGGIDVFNYSTARLFNNTLVKNAAAKYGGAVSDEYESSVVFNGNTFSENSAMNGGGVAIQYNSTANFTGNNFINNSNIGAWEIEIDTTSTATLINNNFINTTGYVVYGSTTNTSSVHYVKPSPDTPCSESPCLTLSEYLRLADQYFTLNTTLMLLPGDHVLQDKLLVRDILALTLTGSTSDGDSSRSLLATATRIICTSTMMFFHFQNISKVHINAVNFVSCGNANFSAMSLLALFHASFSNCTFQNATRGALSVTQTDTLVLTNSRFVDNFSPAFGGGGVHALSVNNAYFTRNEFENNQVADYGSGGSVYIEDSHAYFTGNQFKNNQADFKGGGIYINNSVANFTKNEFKNNRVNLNYGAGGGVHIQDSNANITGNQFNNNQADFKGGGIYINNSVANFTENQFKNNQVNLTYGAGGGVHIQDSKANFTGNQFKNNQAGFKGGGIYINNSVANFTENEFKNNRVNLSYGAGGGVHIQDSNANVTGNQFNNNQAAWGGGVAVYVDSAVDFTENIFMNNTARFGGGGVDVYSNSKANFLNNTLVRNTAAVDGGAVYDEFESSVVFNGNTFSENSARNGGGVAIQYTSTANFTGNTVFQNNSAVNGGAIHAISSTLIIYEKSTFVTNSATYGGAVYAKQCFLIFEGNNIFMNNTASIDGGGMLLTSASKCYLYPNTAIFFENNTAMQHGGALKVDVANQLLYCLNTLPISNNPLNDCFFQLNPGVNYGQFNDFNATMNFNNNTAVEGGSDIYGGAVDNCKLQNAQFGSSSSVFDMITSNSPETPDVSSDPLRICICENNIENCDSRTIMRCAYPGEKFTVSVIAFGQRNSIVSAVIEADLTQDTNIKFDSLHDIQDIDSTCTVIEYTVFSSVGQTQEDITLHAQGPCPPEGRSLELRVEVLQCPHGFVFSSIDSVCVCSKRLEKLTDASSCAIENGTILRPRGASFWVGYSNESDNGTDGLILHPHCPFDYCTSEPIAFYLSPDDSNVQCGNRSMEYYLDVNMNNTLCNNNRNGTLCGQCIQDYSLVLGSSRCLQCTLNSYLALLIAFAFAGIALVFFLFLMKLTVAVGTINGLIFYANVVQVNSAVLFESGTTNILTVFIAWLNLDLGIETCFYDGMDAYDKTWLQFVFPVYVWTLVGIIILFSHFSKMVSSRLGTNPIAVLCTLFLLSYAKVLRTIIAAMSFASLEYPDGSIGNVWREDGNVTYLKGRHIPLFLVALCALFLFLAYSLLLFCGQWLQGMPDSRIFSWISKPTIKSILDAYHAPYAAKHRYWTGLLLLTRSSLFVIFAFNALRNPDVNLFCIMTSALALITIGFVAEKIYANRYLGALEASFIINLGILAAATTFKFAEDNQPALTHTSVSIAFATFIGIVVYHFYLQLKNYELLKMIATLTLAIFHQNKKCNLNAEDVDKELTTSTKSVVLLRESLLEDEL